MKAFLFFLMSLLVSEVAFAQFPTFYPTYKSSFQIEKENLEYPEDLKKALKGFLDSLPDSSVVLDVRTSFYFKKIFDKKNEVLSNEIKQHETKIETLYLNQIPTNQSIREAKVYQDKIYAARAEIYTNSLLSDYLYSINTYYGTPGIHARFFPVRNRNQGNFFYNNVTSSGISTLNSFVIQASENGGAANAEIVSGQIAAVRVSFSSVIQGGGQAIDSLEVNTKLFTGGGISNLHFELPLFYYNRQNILFYSAFKPGFVADIPVFGSDIERDSFSGYADLAGEFLAELRTDGGEFSLFANFKGSYIAGTPTFYSTLKSPDSDAPLGQVDKPFWISQVYVGVSVSKRFRISANIPIATTRQIQLPDKIQVGLQITPDKNK